MRHLFVIMLSQPPPILAAATCGASVKKTHLLLAEDDPATVELLKYHFSREDFFVTHTPSGKEALLLAETIAPDLILLDWMLEELAGIEVCRLLRSAAATRDIPIIMLTARGEEADRIRGLRTGADDYVTKPFSPGELIARVSAMLRRVRPTLAGDTLNFADIEMDVAAHKVKRGGLRVQLGPTEFRLLRHFMEHPGRVFSRERLLNAVWAHDNDIEARTVNVYIRRLRNALNGNQAPDLIRTVHGEGYALDEAS